VIFAVVGNHRKQEPAKEKNIPNEGYIPTTFAIDKWFSGCGFNVPLVL
jgi:hypothetical protein